MKALRIVISPAFVFLLLISAFVILRGSEGERASLFGVLAFTAFAGIELMNVLASLLRRRPRRFVLAHALNATGGACLGGTWLAESNLILLSFGAATLCVGLLLLGREVANIPR